ncbi:MAG: hypothetical protein V3U96_06295 [Paracoccaceae bacterium]
MATIKKSTAVVALAAICIVPLAVSGLPVVSPMAFAQSAKVSDETNFFLNRQPAIRNLFAKVLTGVSPLRMSTSVEPYQRSALARPASPMSQTNRLPSIFIANPEFSSGISGLPLAISTNQDLNAPVNFTFIRSDPPKLMAKNLSTPLSNGDLGNTPLTDTDISEASLDF